MTKKLLEQIVPACKTAMAARGIGVNELGRRVDLSGAQISRFLNGKTELSLAKLQAVLDVLQIAVNLTPKKK